MTTDFSKWPTKQEARLKLGGVPERSFDRWLAQHNVKVGYLKVTGRRPVPVVDPAGIALIEREMMSMGPPLPAAQNSSGLPALPPIPPAWREMAATFFSHLPLQQQPLFLTLKEAKTYSGLSEERLKRLVNDGTVFGFTRDPGYRISRKSLDAFAEGPDSQKSIPPVARTGRKKP